MSEGGSGAQMQPSGFRRTSSHGNHGTACRRCSPRETANSGFVSVESGADSLARKWGARSGVGGVCAVGETGLVREWRHSRRRAARRSVSSQPQPEPGPARASFRFLLGLTASSVFPMNSNQLK